MSYWKTYYHTQSSDEKTEHIKAQYYLNFPKSEKNNNEWRPVIEIEFHIYKNPKGWWISDKEFYQPKPYKVCEVTFHHFQSMPKENFWSSKKEGRVSYTKFTLDYCKAEAEKILKSKLQSLVDQIL
jgi:hypothetical protein